MEEVLKTLPIPKGEIPWVKGGAADPIEYYAESNLDEKASLEFGIDQAVYNAFDLTKEEIELLEEYEDAHLELNVLEAEVPK